MQTCDKLVIGIFYNSRNEVSVLSKKQQTTLLKNSILLLILIVFCAILSRCALKGETLSEYEKKQAEKNVNSPITENILNDSISNATATESINETSIESTSEAPSESTEKISDKANINPDNTTPKEAPMPDRITYQNGFYYESLSTDMIKRIRGCSYPADDTN